jgi:hypothetical protein
MSDRYIFLTCRFKVLFIRQGGAKCVYKKKKIPVND